MSEDRLLLTEAESTHLLFDVTLIEINENWHTLEQTLLENFGLQIRDPISAKNLIFSAKIAIDYESLKNIFCSSTAKRLEGLMDDLIASQEGWEGMPAEVSYFRKLFKLLSERGENPFLYICQELILMWKPKGLSKWTWLSGKVSPLVLVHLDLFLSSQVGWKEIAEIQQIS